jgi:sortase A
MTATDVDAIEYPSETSPPLGRPAFAHAGPDASVPPRGVALRRRASPRRLTAVTVFGLVALVAAAGVVVYEIGPLNHARDQGSLLASERRAITDAAEETGGLGGVTLPSQPPSLGSPVGIVDIPALRLQQVVVEGVGPSQTVDGPGHVPGTAGLGQPGNAAVVARRAGYGGPFSGLSKLHRGDRIVTAGIEGQSEYLVQTVRTITLTDAAPAPAGDGLLGSSTPPPGASSTPPPGTSGSSVVKSPAGPVSVSTVYGPTKQNQLTLVTSASVLPWNHTKATVVVAQLRGQPFTPTPQESTGVSGYGTRGDSAAWAGLILAVLALVVAGAGTVALFRRGTVRAAFLLTAAPLFALTVVAAESASRLLPAWL